MVVLITFKYEEDPTKMNTLKWPQHNTSICQMLKGSFLHTVVSAGILRKFKLVQGLMHVLICCDNEDDPIKNECAREATTFRPL